MKYSFFVKISVAVVIAIGVAVCAAVVSTHAVTPKMPAHNAYIVEGVGKASAVAAAPKGPAPIEPLLAKADLAAGQKTARVCGTCHSFNKGEAAKMGPNLYGVVGGPHAHMAGFAYSEAMIAMRDMQGHMWGFDELNHFIYSPRTHLPGTKMSFPGLKNDQDRANVIAWLNSQSDKPLPLPK